MDSTHEGSGEISRAKEKKTPGSTRFTWTTEQEKTLLQALKELLVQGWKSDNGFRAGYLNKLEAEMKKSHPEANIKAFPHINSKITTWKRHYGSLCHILSQSGVGFNLDGTFKIDCHNDQWESIVKTTNNAHGMREKNWPYFEAWKEIFGKDRATGETAEDILEAVNNLERECSTMADDYLAGDYHVELEDMLEKEKGEASVCQSQQPNRVQNNTGKKRKSRDAMEQVCTLLGEINANTNARLEALTSRIGYEHDLGKARMELFDKIDTIPDLSLDEKFEACGIIAAKVEYLEIFIGLNEEGRGKYVHHLLKFKSTG